MHAAAKAKFLTEPNARIGRLGTGLSLFTSVQAPNASATAFEGAAGPSEPDLHET